MAECNTKEESLRSEGRYIIYDKQNKHFDFIHKTLVKSCFLQAYFTKTLQ